MTTHDPYDDLLKMCRLLIAGPANPQSDDEILALRDASKTDDRACEVLRDLIYKGDGRQRILAAEALSWTGKYAEDSVGVLVVLIEVLTAEKDLTKSEDWAVLALGALANYGTDAEYAAPSFWPFLHKPVSLNVLLYATRLAARLAVCGKESWTVWCHLCRHEEESVRDLARSEFKSFNNLDN